MSLSEILQVLQFASLRLLGLACSPRHSYAEEFPGLDPAR